MIDLIFATTKCIACTDAILFIQGSYVTEVVPFDNSYCGPSDCIALDSHWFPPASAGVESSFDIVCTAGHQYVFGDCVTGK